MTGIASAATSVLIGYLAANTDTLHLGSGGVMLPNHSPLVIAEQFGTLNTLYPGRIDLGLGRAPGSDQRTMMALRRHMSGDVDNFPRDVAELVVDPPANYEAAVAQVHAGQGAAAIPALQKIVKEYAHLQWDKTAGRSLAEAYISSGKAEDGLRICEGIIRDDATAAYKGDLAPAYWAALLALDKRSRLEGSLAKAAKSGDRFSAGAALIKRGDIALKDGKDSAEANRKALTDGYLRVVLLYRDEEFAAKLQPEALYKAAQCFEKLNMSGRADSMRGTLKQLYASSPWAAK